MGKTSLEAPFSFPSITNLLIDPLLQLDVVATDAIHTFCLVECQVCSVPQVIQFFTTTSNSETGLFVPGRFVPGGLIGGVIGGVIGGLVGGLVGGLIGGLVGGLIGGRGLGQLGLLGLLGGLLGLPGLPGLPVGLPGQLGLPGLPGLLPLPLPLPLPLFVEDSPKMSDK